MRAKQKTGALAVLTLMSILFAPMAQACAIPANSGALKAELLSAVNAQRARAGLSRLAPSPRLDHAAQIVSCDNARRDMLSHSTADGSDLRSRLAASGYRFRMANENLTQRRAGPQAAVQAWMNSPSHRTNLLARQSREFGGAVARSASGQLYWTMVSAAPR